LKRLAQALELNDLDDCREQRLSVLQTGPRVDPKNVGFRRGVCVKLYREPEHREDRDKAEEQESSRHLDDLQESFKRGL
jgi:hypothetical protein